MSEEPTTKKTILADPVVQILCALVVVFLYVCFSAACCYVTLILQGRVYQSPEVKNVAAK